jgi:signal transduction histidine kinase
MPPVITIQLVARSILWLLIFALAIVVNTLLDVAPRTWLFYGVGLVLTTAQWGLLLALGDNELVWDIRELCFYDILAQCIGLGLHFFWYNYPLYTGICNAIFLLKITRLLWWAKLPDGSALVSWPVMGPVGYWCRNYRPGAARIGGSRQQDAWAYGAVGMAGITVWALHALQVKMGLTFWASFIVIVILAGFRRFMGNLARDQARHATNEKSAAREEATAAANAKLTSLNTELTATNTKLAEAEAAANALNRDLANTNAKLAEATATTLAQNATLAKLNAELAIAKAATDEKNQELATANRLLAEEKAATEAKNAELRIAYDTVAAARADAERTNEILRNCAHDLKKPLDIIALITETGLAEVDAEQRAATSEKLAYLIRSYGDAIDDTIEIAKLRTHLLVPKIEPISTSELLRYSWPGWMQLAASEDAELQIRCMPRDDDFTVLTDFDLFNRILTNLISNAIVQSKGWYVRLSLRKRGNRCRVAVLDRGPGMAHASGRDGAANFRAFVAAIKANTAHSAGGQHGLGLNNVKELCERIGSRMQLRAKPGSGAVFYFDIPCPAA